MNIIETAMREKCFNLQQAIEYAGALVTERVQLFVETKKNLPSWGQAVDKQVAQYLQCCEDWMTGGFHWSLRSDRYFGDEVEEVKRTLVVKLLPKRMPRGQAVIPDL